MKRTWMALGGLLLAGMAHAALDDYYYTYDEIEHELDSLAAAHPTIMRVDSIGYAWESMRPIWSVKLSQNVDQELDKPAFWVNGQCHAEEILGVNISMAFIRELAHWGDLGHPNYTPFLQAMEIHVVPTNNPDGMDVVVTETDRTYRKNLHNFLPDHICQITPGIGNDSCGVDLNRNYPAWFEHGDPLWAVNADPEQFDYYRGPAPLSEPECNAIALQTERERFVAAVAYHSARTSTNHEIIIHPWEWEVGKTCPPRDYDMQQTLTRTMGDQISGENFEFYRNIAGGGRKGNHHNWIYSAYGAVGLLIEVGTQHDEGMQPQDSEEIQFIIDENLDGLYWLCRRIIGYQQDAPGLQLHVTDGEGAPLEARLRLEEVMHPDCAPYYRTDPQWGAYYRLLWPGTYTMALRKHGYVSQTFQQAIGNSAPTQVEVMLEELPRHAVDLDFTAYGGGSLNVERVELYDHGSDTTLVYEDLSSLTAELPEGVYTLKAISGSHISARVTLDLFGALSGSQVLYPRDGNEPNLDVALDQLEDFEQLGTNCGWVVEERFGEMAFNDTPGLWSADDMDCELRSIESFELAALVRDHTPGTLEFDYAWNLEGGRDSAFVVIHDMGMQQSENVIRLTGQRDRWEHAVVDLSPWTGSEISVGFRVKTDGTVHDQGLFVRNVRLSWNTEATDVADPVLPAGFALGVAPNPFNPRTTVSLQVPATHTGARLDLHLYDLLGRRVATLTQNEALDSGQLLLPLDGSGLASGVYILDAVVSQDGRRLFRENRRVALVK